MVYWPKHVWVAIENNSLNFQTEIVYRAVKQNLVFLSLYSFLCTLIVSCDNTTKCSNHGTCGDDGTCVCNDNYYGIDCSSKPIFLLFYCEYCWKFDATTSEFEINLTPFVLSYFW